MNPYAQGGWSNPLNPSAVNNPTGTNTSVYGALPYFSQSATPAFLSFIFASTDGTVLNSTIIGPQSRKYFQVSTDSTASGYSVVQNSQMESVALIEWGNNPIVEIREIVARQQTAQFLPLSPDKSQVISML
jgi:hypothetical protein